MMCNFKNSANKLQKGVSDVWENVFAINVWEKNLLIKFLTSLDILPTAVNIVQIHVIYSVV